MERRLEYRGTGTTKWEIENNKKMSHPPKQPAYISSEAVSSSFQPVCGSFAWPWIVRAGRQQADTLQIICSVFNLHNPPGLTQELKLVPPHMSQPGAHIFIPVLVYHSPASLARTSALIIKKKVSWGCIF